eukprot:8079033-Pyramimonas_sp.AAC.2
MANSEQRIAELCAHSDERRALAATRAHLPKHQQNHEELKEAARCEPNADQHSNALAVLGADEGGGQSSVKINDECVRTHCCSTYTRHRHSAGLTHLIRRTTPRRSHDAGARALACAMAQYGGTPLLIRRPPTNCACQRT